jgi:hypothetical protein
MYSLQLNLDSTKEVTNIKLLKSVEATAVHIFSISGIPIVNPLKVDLSDYYNEDGISFDDNKQDGLIEGWDALFPVEMFASGGREFMASLMASVDTENGKRNDNFAIGPRLAGENNFIGAEAQEIKVKEDKYYLQQKYFKR